MLNVHAEYSEESNKYLILTGHVKFKKLGDLPSDQQSQINRYFTKIENYFEEQGISNSREHYNSWRKDPNKSSREIYDEENDSFGIVGHIPNIPSRGIDMKLEERIVSIVSEIENIRRNHFHETFFS